MSRAAFVARLEARLGAVDLYFVDREEIITCPHIHDSVDAARTR